MRIKIIENDKQLKDLIGVKLEVEGFEIVDHDADLCIVDLGLDDGICWDLLKDLRKKHKGPIVIYSGYSDISYKRRALDIGCNGYIDKIIQPNLFILEIKFIISTYKLCGKN